MISFLGERLLHKWKHGLEVTDREGPGAEEIGRTGRKGTSDQDPNHCLPASPPGFMNKALKWPSYQSRGLEEAVGTPATVP